MARGGDYALALCVTVRSLHAERDERGLHVPSRTAAPEPGRSGAPSVCGSVDLPPPVARGG
ncbi:hypothetical protein SAM23877_4759 [Streptomyces ambofaciens ATCC 23877]|uniref:Uncharacterized protein n=1 Tax=Streptomyces ambofaciens (strain ATCC 23877 / 3486 / DSM 40053 / JCM 4204 / NBRC 12836 / NRRL B-2516) TaxID=278992 RepID=A0A0K2AXP4_STRA7|nr:hypothetical protein SAM23877_4759 [Streptomyces ambofaciens ATCC 23877]